MQKQINKYLIYKKKNKIQPEYTKEYRRNEEKIFQVSEKSIKKAA